jgi:hypothetical protein
MRFSKEGKGRQALPKMKNFRGKEKSSGKLLMRTNKSLEKHYPQKREGDTSIERNYFCNIFCWC